MLGKTRAASTAESTIDERDPGAPDDGTPEAPWRERWYWALLGQVVLVAGAILLYFGVRGLTERRASTAFTNARWLREFETTMKVDIEEFLQRWILEHDVIVTLANWVYIWGHWPVILTTFVWLFARHRDEYVLLRNAMFISGAIGLVMFAVYPVAPPRLLPDFVDTVTERSETYRVLQPPALVNKYAAMPSLHFGWNLLVGIFIYRVARSRLAEAYAILGPLLMGAAIILTANHFVVDAIVGGAVAMIGLGAVITFDRRQKQRHPRRAGSVPPEQPPHSR